MSEYKISEREIISLLKRCQEKSIKVPQGLSRTERHEWAKQQQAKTS